MIGWNEVPKRPFGDMQGIPAETLVTMYHEMKSEVDAVLPEGREQAARRNGLERVIPHLRAKGFGWLVDEMAPPVCTGDNEPTGRAVESDAARGSSGIQGSGTGAPGTSVEAA